MPIDDVSGKSLGDLLSLEGRAAVVTGGASGIGNAIARRLAEAGALVLIADRDIEGAEEEANEIDRWAPTSVLGTYVDVRDSTALGAVADRAVSEFGRLDVWINDAGVQPLQSGEELTDEEWREIIDTNLSGTFYGCRAAHLHMKGSGGGVIVNVASSLGFHGVKEQPHYVASKWGVRGLTAALALDYGPDVRVVAVAPGLTDTPGVRAKLDGLDRLAGGDAFGAVASLYPAGRAGVPDDIARAVVFLAGDAAAFLTGSTLLADGGEIAAGGAG